MGEIKTDKVLAIIQARMNSTRLPGKMLLPIINGKGALELMLERVSQAKMLGKVVVATTKSTSDDPLEELCKSIGYKFFRGSEDDVLDRYYQTALTFGSADVIVRLTGDCPLHDPVIIDDVVKCFLDSGVDYVSNTNPPTYPDGLDVGVFSFSVLEEAWQQARLKSEREHVTPYIRNHPEEFKILNVEYVEDLSGKRWTLDNREDYEFIKHIYNNLYKEKHIFGMEEILDFLKKRPEIEQINEHISRNEGYQKSLEEDEILDSGNSKN